MTETDKEIYFYNAKDKFGYMSNFYKTSFKDDNNVYNCSEQYFMYMKCKTFDKDNITLLNEILKETSPMKIKYYGRQVRNYNDKVWEEKRYGIMVEALKLKFSQDKNLGHALASTKPKMLYEASKYDKIWGIGFYDYEAIKTDKKQFGRNLLGKALMEVREWLQA